MKKVRISDFEGRFHDYYIHEILEINEVKRFSEAPYSSITLSNGDIIQSPFSKDIIVKHIKKIKESNS